MRHPKAGKPAGGGGPPHADESFLRRWSRRKRGLDTTEPEPVPVPEEAPAAPAPETELRDEDMPDLSTIDAESDLRPFFSPGVSEHLRQAALKQLFRSAKFNVRDGLDDYDDDFRSFQALGDIVTADMRLQQERAEARARAALAEEAAREEAEEAPPGPSTPPAVADGGEVAEDEPAAEDGDRGRG